MISTGSAIKSGIGIAAKIAELPVQMKLLGLMNKYGVRDKSLNDKLIKLIPQDEDVLVGDLGPSSFYFNPKRLTARERELMMKALDSMKVDPDKLDSINSYIYKSIKSLKLLVIVSDLNGVEATAHEIGHLMIDYKGGILSKLQGNRIIGVLKNGPIPGMTSFALALFGKDIASVVVPFVMKTPLLITEFMASKNGMDLLVKAGATREQLNNAKNSLRAAWGTYFMNAIKTSTSGLILSPLGEMVTKRFAAVRNPYKERRMEEMMEKGMIPVDSETGQPVHNEPSVDVMDAKPQDAKDVARNLGVDKNKTPVYQNLTPNKKDKEVTAATATDKNRLRNKNVNQNINITRNTTVTNNSKDKETETNAQLQIYENQSKNTNGESVNAKLIEIQKTNPLKPVSMNK